MVLDIISICLSIGLLVMILLLHKKVLKRFNDIENNQRDRFNDIERDQQRVLKRANPFIENDQVPPSNQSKQLPPNDPVEEEDYTNGNWQKQFADGFISYLRNNKSRLVPIFMGERTWGYPDYIGFDIRRLGENVNFNDNNAVWLVAYIGRDDTIFLKLHMNKLSYFNRLKSQEVAIHRDFGTHLLWEDQGKKPLRIGVDLSVDSLNENRQKWPEHFKKMRENLEKLDEVFQHRVNEFFEDNPPFS